MKKGIWVEFVQVRVRTNIAPSNAFGLVQMLQEIVLGRLRGRIRRLFDVGAGIRVEMRGERGTVASILLGGRPWEKISHHKITRNPIPQRGILPPPNKLYSAIAPRRVRKLPQQYTNGRNLSP